MEDKIVTLDTFMDFMQAEFALGKLQTAGIQCFMDENATNIYPLYTDALGAYKIKVFERDLEKCREILSQDKDAD
ncbi:DUF2007 domain-containing protein [Mucilaginibacter sp. dw_454]|uniref:putative signal transducing protein n=1 Tax=Mucilaginibacter sp. dw_454 TaxID=2720079 RepID=UPI001BD69BFE|nr:DUF2007 domain-containing protein [Mucilaginibacter sp. dw_454]